MAEMRQEISSRKRYVGSDPPNGMKSFGGYTCLFSPKRDEKLCFNLRTAVALAVEPFDIACTLPVTLHGYAVQRNSHWDVERAHVVTAATPHQ